MHHRSDAPGDRRGYVGIRHVAGPAEPSMGQEREPMEHVKSEIWDLAAATFIAVSIICGMAFIIATAI